MNRNTVVNGNLIGILGGIILSTDSLFIRLMAVDNSWLIVVLRGVLMWAVMFAVWGLWPKSRAVLGVPWITRQNLLPALFFCAASACFVNALNRGNIATVLVIISSTPFVSAIISRLFFATKIDRSLMGAAMVGMLGVVIVMTGRQSGYDGSANYFALATAVCMALAFIFASRVEQGTLALPSLGGVLASVVVSLFAGSGLVTPLLALHAGQWGWLVIEGALIIPVAMGLISLSTRYVPPANAGLFLLLETALAPLWIYLFLQQAPTLHAVVGGGIIIMAVISQTLRVKKQAAIAL
ncbi:DMT family transporter [Rahnella sp. SAP-1]|uniref:DMT family transporter n=1 Tax=Rouxiella aceris TaxID=2703884 RepID=A0A848MIL1_9GAMM|nr:DMT family transporter [Rouxiella aceris]NMP26164.1 DMT family transporter [Rouxiella aceris]